MKCDTCDVTLTERISTRANPYRYELSGLANVALVGIKVRACPKCRHQWPTIPRLAELHRALALLVVNKHGPLAGSEVRFLRKRIGLPAQAFAKLLGVSAAHFSRVENGRKSLGRSADILVRALATTTADATIDTRDVLLGAARRLDSGVPRTTKCPTLTLRGSKWAA